MGKCEFINYDNDSDNEEHYKIVGSEEIFDFEKEKEEISEESPGEFGDFIEPSTDDHRQDQINLKILTPKIITGIDNLRYYTVVFP